MLTFGLFQLVCCDLLHYKILSEVKISTYEASDGSKPFASVDEKEIASTAVLFLNE